MGEKEILDCTICGPAGKCEGFEPNAFNKQLCVCGHHLKDHAHLDEEGKENEEEKQAAVAKESQEDASSSSEEDSGNESGSGPDVIEEVLYNSTGPSMFESRSPEDRYNPSKDKKVLEVFGKKKASTYAKLLRRVNRSAHVVECLPEMRRSENFKLGRVSSKIYESIEESHPHDEHAFPLLRSPVEKREKAASLKLDTTIVGSPHSQGSSPHSAHSHFGPASPTFSAGSISPARSPLHPRDVVARSMVESPSKFRPKPPPDDLAQLHPDLEAVSHAPPGLAPGPQLSTSRGAEEFYNYYGKFKAGKPHGHGVFIFADGCKYRGDWSDALPSGTGRADYPDGTVYEGKWKRGLPHGNGLFSYANGAVYEGSLAAGKRHGKGKLILPGGVEYDGEWAHGQKHGRGQLTSKSGYKYLGSWREGLINGSGALYFPGESERIVRMWPPLTFKEAIQSIIEERRQKRIKREKALWDIHTRVREIELKDYVEEVRQHNIEMAAEKLRIEEEERARIRRERREQVRKAREAAMAAARAAAAAEAESGGQ